MRSNLPDPQYFLRRTVPGRDIEFVSYVASGNDGHLFRGYSGSLRRDVACKVVPRGNLQHGADGSEAWRDEIHKADILRTSTVVKFEDVRVWRDPIHNIDCVVLISEFVEGVSLRVFMEKHADSITVPLIRYWLATMLNLLHEMQLRGVVHGDLHDANILVEDRSSFDLLGPRFVFRVTDFGVAEAASEQRLRDDFLQLAEVLAKLLRRIDYASCGPKDKYLFHVLRDHFMARHLAEESSLLDPLARQPRALLEKLGRLDADFDASLGSKPSTLLSPFDFLSCEQIPEATLLQALYSQHFLGLPEIEGRNNVVITGPRGCGKSTVFRCLSLEQRIRVSEDDPKSVEYIGVYYQCADLHHAFARYQLPDREEALDVPLHFVIATLLAKLFDCIESWGRRHFAEELARDESRLVDALWGAIGWTAPGAPGASTLKYMISRLEKERIKATERHRFSNDKSRPIGGCFRSDVLLRVCAALSDELSFLRNRPIYFFVDDYSTPKITKDLQANLNRLFMQRTSSCFFKLSTESPVSFAKHDIDGKIYVENREFIMHNLGLVYLHADVSQKLVFIEDVFRRRLSSSRVGSVIADLESIVGSRGHLNNNDLARQIRDGEKPLLWGKEVLCNLCSGDVHYLISLVGDMVKQAGGFHDPSVSNTRPLVPEAVQSRAIREAAGAFLRNLRGVPKCGEQLVSIVEAFGNVAYSHLKFLESKNEEGSPPKQASRIEPYEPFALSNEAKDLYDELLRYSVFIEDFRGKSRRGSVVPRLYMRRFLLPHFNLTFSLRDSIELEAMEFEQFLCHPRKFDLRLRLKNSDDAARYERKGMSSRNQMQLDWDSSP